jgi:hypothetical protein
MSNTTGAIRCLNARSVGEVSAACAAFHGEMPDAIVQFAIAASVSSQFIGRGLLIEPQRQA